MSDHTDDPAIINGIVGIRIKEGRLEYGSREYDLIVGRIIISIDGLDRKSVV
jgi:hypothetical protein